MSLPPGGSPAPVYDAVDVLVGCGDVFFPWGGSDSFGVAVPVVAVLGCVYAVGDRTCMSCSGTFDYLAAGGVGNVWHFVSC